MKGMMMMKVLFVSGSNRGGATSTKLLRYMASAAQRKGAEPIVFDLWEKPIPLYSPDVAPSDPNVTALLQAAQDADAIVLGGPEYHGSISGVLKNALDFMGSVHFSGKPVLSVSSSGGSVAVASLTQLQAIVRNLHGINSPEWVSIGGEQRQFAPDGAPMQEAVRTRADRAIDTLLSLAQALRKENAAHTR
jgi:azobenzene reductase